MLYYFVLLALPPLSFKTKPDIAFNELKDTLSLNLTPHDQKRLESLLRTIDLYNIRAFWLGQPLDDRGNLGAKNLEEALLVRDRFPQYLIDFLERYETTHERLRNFPALIASLYQEKGEQEKGFLRRYFQFERELMLMLSALRAKQTGRDIVRELQFEDPLDPTVAYILAQRDAADFTPPQEFEQLKILFVENSRDPEKLNRAILEYRFDKIEEMEQEIPPFSMDQVLAYVAKFLIIDSWFQRDMEKGHLAVEELSQYG